MLAAERPIASHPGPIIGSTEAALICRVYLEQLPATGLRCSSTSTTAEDPGSVELHPHQFRRQRRAQSGPARRSRSAATGRGSRPAGYRVVVEELVVIDPKSP